MTLDQIKTAVDSGQRVHWASTLYDVVRDDIGQYLIICTSNQYCIGLTWKDGKTLNGKESEFFTEVEL